MPLFPPAGGTSPVVDLGFVDVAEFIQAGDGTNTSPALQRAYDSLAGGGGVLLLAGRIAWNWQSKVFFDSATTPASVRLQGEGMATLNTINPLLDQDPLCAMVNGQNTFTDLLAGPEDIGALVSGPAAGNFPSGTTITDVNTGTHVVTTSNPWAGATGNFTIRVQRFVIYENIGRTTGTFAAIGNVPGQLVINEMQFDTTNDNDNLLGFVLTARAGVWSRNLCVQHVYRFAKTTSDYTDAMRFDSILYKNSPVGTIHTGNNVGMGCLYEQTNSGDGLVMLQCKGGQGDMIYNGSNCNGAFISGAISTSLRFNSCSAIEIEGFHWDSNQNGGPAFADATDGGPCAIYCVNSQLTITSPFWHAGPSKTSLSLNWHFIEINDGTNDHIAPPYTAGSFITVVGGSGNFRYDHTAGGLAAEDQRFPDINIRSMNQTTRLQFRGVRYDVYKQASGTSQQGKSPGAPWIGSYTDGATTLVAGGAGPTGAAIVAAATKARGILTGDWELRCNGNGLFTILPISSTGSPARVVERASGGAPTIVSGTNTTTPGALAASTTYNYACALRNFDGSFSAVSNVVSVALAAGAGNTLNDLVITAARAGAWGLVIWRSLNAANVLTTPASYVELPFSGNALFPRDSGTRCDGLSWISTAVPVPNTVASADFTWDGYVTPAGQRVAFMAAAPSSAQSGPWSQGDIVWFSNVAAGGAPGAVCTAGGSPGTWKAMAAVAP